MWVRVSEDEGMVDLWVRLREERRWVTGLSSEESDKKIHT